jgi:hypothetical protein
MPRRRSSSMAPESMSAAMGFIGASPFGRRIVISQRLSRGSARAGGAMTWSAPPQREPSRDGMLGSGGMRLVPHRSSGSTVMADSEATGRTRMRRLPALRVRPTSVCLLGVRSRFVELTTPIVGPGRLDRHGLGSRVVLRSCADWWLRHSSAVGAGILPGWSRPITRFGASPSSSPMSRAARA